MSVLLTYSTMLEIHGLPVEVFYERKRVLDDLNSNSCFKIKKVMLYGCDVTLMISNEMLQKIEQKITCKIYGKKQMQDDDDETLWKEIMKHKIASSD